MEKKEDKQKEDTQKVNLMIEKLNEGNKKKAKVLKVTRLQRKPENKHAPVIIVELENEDARNELLYSAKNFKNMRGLEKVFLGADIR